MKADIDGVREFWDTYVCGDIFARQTEQGTKAYFEEIRRNRYHYEYHLKPFLQRVASSGHTVLEIGCGIGTDAAELAKLGMDVTAIDLSPRSVQLARQYFEFEGLRADLRVGNAESLEFADSTFDCVYSFGVLHHTPNIEQALGETHRVLKPGGKIFLMLYSRYSLNNFVHILFRIPYESPRSWKVDAPITRSFSREEVLNLMRDYQDLRMEKRYLFGAGWWPVSDILPVSINDLLGRVLGWHWLIEGTKEELAG